MKINPAEQVFEELLPYLETLDAQIGALVQLLKDKGMTTNEEFAQYVQRADRASKRQEARNARKNGIPVHQRRQPERRIMSIAKCLLAVKGDDDARLFVGDCRCSSRNASCRLALS